jgi:hypothetical protein
LRRAASGIGHAMLKLCRTRAETLPGVEHWEVPMRCARCSKPALVEIRMRVGDRELTFRRCGRCEAQSWETADGPVPLSHVLDLARVG